MSDESLKFPSWAHIHESRLGHVEGVAALLSAWADEMAIPAEERARWHKAVILHDSLKDAPAEMLDELVPDCWEIPSLKHGPAAAVMAERDGEKDSGVLNAVRYHSVGYSGWEMIGKVLFLADYLEEGRDFHTEHHTQLSRRVPGDLNSVLRAVTVERLSDILAYDFPLLPETVEFWNSLIGAR